ncbi:MAG: hypothetical protein BWZ02_03239 [Lentisphaerae bacterium ADurb.BinA184]|nr:MAG: hypothetical protein BWZ02_03239 [Lentisphaerae bacterium ADurb.BinA184]
MSPAASARRAPSVSKTLIRVCSCPTQSRPSRSAASAMGSLTANSPWAAPVTLWYLRTLPARASAAKIVSPTMARARMGARMRAASASGVSGGTCRSGHS